MSPETECENPITIFAMPKAFEGHSGVIQRNALASWVRLAPAVEVILFGDDAGVAEAAAEFGVRHVADVQRTEHGTPLISDMFSRAHEMSKGRVLAYVNADIILLEDFPAAVAILDSAPWGDYLMIGRRTDLDVVDPIDMDEDAARNELLDFAKQKGKLAPVVCKDYFVFPKPLYADIPAFAIGRGNWDNWMVHHAHESKLPVIDATKSILAIHQNHDYAHIKGGRMNAYVKGDEAERNRELAGGRHLVSGCASNWYLTATEVKRKTFGFRFLPFFSDLPNFLKLLADLAGYTRKKTTGP